MIDTSGWRKRQIEKQVHIEEVVAFIKATREEAVALAYEIGGGEVHALHIQRGFESPAEKPVGYYVMPTKEWVGLTDEEIEQGHKDSWVTKQAFESACWWAEKILKEKNT